MIVVKLIGGLGNQMFQYAAGRSLADVLETELFVDVSALEQDPAGAYTPRRYELGEFNIRANIATQEVLSNFDFNTPRWIRKLQSFFPAYSTHMIFNESTAKFHKQFYKLPLNTYLNGYWQNEKYFVSIRDKLISEFELKAPKSSSYLTLLKTITSCESVSLHIRRGDYVSLQSANLYHGVLSKEYYQNAVLYFTEQKRNFCYFVFSDDLDWCKKNLDFIHTCTYVNGSQFGLSVHEELLLMSMCKHNIIANSSFSWWAAWLNNYSQKTVLAPAQWFNTKQSQPSELLLNTWKKIKLKNG